MIRPQLAPPGAAANLEEFIIAATSGEERATENLPINGKLCPAQAKRLDVINPATEDVLAEAPRANRAQLDKAVAAAKAAFPGWSAEIPMIPERVPLGKAGRCAGDKTRRICAPVLTLNSAPLSGGELGDFILLSRIIRYYASLDLPDVVLKEDATQKSCGSTSPSAVAAIVPEFSMLLLVIKVAWRCLLGIRWSRSRQRRR